MQSESNGLSPAADQGAAEDELARRRAAIAHAESTLRGQRGELLRMMAELKQLQEVVRSGQAPELEALRRENEELRRNLAERDQAQAAPALPPEVVAERDALRAEVDQLRRLVQEKDALLAQLKDRPATAPRTASDLETYEAELNQFRLQLEEDRRRLNEELEHVRVRNQELDEANREMELELSRERVDLARERTRLERVRDEARAEMERFQRDAGVWNRLAPVQRLRDELTDRKEASEQS
jgi:chromosome segregation ATPase